MYITHILYIIYYIIILLLYIYILYYTLPLLFFSSSLNLPSLILFHQSFPSDLTFLPSIPLPPTFILYVSVFILGYLYLLNHIPFSFLSHQHPLQYSSLILFPIPLLPFLSYLLFSSSSNHSIRVGSYIHLLILFLYNPFLSYSTQYSSIILEVFIPFICLYILDGYLYSVLVYKFELVFEIGLPYYILFLLSSIFLYLNC